jgi:hypothetical protein
MPQRGRELLLRPGNARECLANERRGGAPANPPTTGSLGRHKETCVQKTT